MPSIAWPWPGGKRKHPESRILGNCRLTGRFCKKAISTDPASTGGKRPAPRRAHDDREALRARRFVAPRQRKSVRGSIAGESRRQDAPFLHHRTTQPKNRAARSHRKRLSLLPEERHCRCRAVSRAEQNELGFVATSVRKMRENHRRRRRPVQVCDRECSDQKFLTRINQRTQRQGCKRSRRGDIEHSLKLCRQSRNPLPHEGCPSTISWPNGLRESVYRSHHRCILRGAQPRALNQTI